MCTRVHTCTHAVNNTIFKSTAAAVLGNILDIKFHDFLGQLRYIAMHMKILNFTWLTCVPKSGNESVYFRAMSISFNGPYYETLAKDYNLPFTV